MKLVELTVHEFINVLGSNKPAPGGGSASALAAAMGASLTMMVAELTIGKKKYADYELTIQAVLAQVKEMQSALLVTIDKDTEAFNAVSAVFSMPKETAEALEKRQEALQNALKGAAISPFEMMTIIVKLLEETQKLVHNSNPNAASDLGVSALTLKSGLQGAWLNILINLSGIKDETFVSTYKKEGAALLTKGTEIADIIYQEILKIV